MKKVPSFKGYEKDPPRDNQNWIRLRTNTGFYFLSGEDLIHLMVCVISMHALYSHAVLYIYTMIGCVYAILLELTIIFRAILNTLTALVVI